MRFTRECAPTLTRTYVVGYRPPALFIDEFMADNDTAIQDPDEPVPAYNDWLEIYNAESFPISLSGRAGNCCWKRPHCSGSIFPIFGFELPAVRPLSRPIWPEKERSAPRSLVRASDPRALPEPGKRASGGCHTRPKLVACK